MLYGGRGEGSIENVGVFVRMERCSRFGKGMGSVDIAQCSTGADEANISPTWLVVLLSRFDCSMACTNIV
jgi:hypothetical protein